MGEGREGDWECSGCRNRNYAFRSFCNRCKQPRLLVDTKTPADSKWLPRIGDWICTGCTNNNYASREKCKKCGQPKEVAAMPAVAMPGASLPTYSHYFARTLGLQEHNLNPGLPGNGALQQQIPLNPSWSSGGANNFEVHPTSTWPLVGNQIYGLPHVGPKGWRNGDWICNCGFHNYSSRAQCKQCNGSVPPGPPILILSKGACGLMDKSLGFFYALGTKRLASEEFVHDWENKRLNSGNMPVQHEVYPGFDQMEGTGHPRPGVYASLPNVSTGVLPNWQASLQFPHQATTQMLVGKGAKHWRDGDWMCTNCSNHNYASRSQCNRCKAQRDGVAQTATKPVES